MAYFPPLPLSRKVEVKINLENYTTKDNLKGATGVDITGFLKKDVFKVLQQKVDSLD